MAPDDPAPNRRPGNRARALRPRRAPGVAVTVCDQRGHPLAPALARWLASAAPARARGEVSVALVSDARIRMLNRQYRRLDAATDVLSFPAGEPSSRGTRVTARQTKRSPSVAGGTVFLGDIVIARGLARRQAREAGHDEATELRVLALHGLLHLLGYDHERDAGQMARLERRLRRRAGLAGGLIERATR